jgi:hypothetical protein
MRRSAKETAYYFNGKLPHLALIAEGVRIPRGRWIWVAAKSPAPWLVETLVRDLFPLVKNANLPFSALLTDFDVDEFEQALGKGKTGR